MTYSTSSVISFGDLIRQGRENLNHSRAQAARSLKIRRHRLACIENGTLFPDAETVKRIAAYLDAPVDEFLARAGHVELEAEDLLKTPDAPHPEFCYGCPLPRGASRVDPYNAFCAYCPAAPDLPSECPATCNLVAGDYTECPEAIRRACPCFAVPTVTEGEARKDAFRAYRERQERDEQQWERHDKVFRARLIHEKVQTKRTRRDDGAREERHEHDPKTRRQAKKKESLQPATP